MSPSIFRRSRRTADPRQHRQLYQSAAFRRRVLNPLPENAARKGTIDDPTNATYGLADHARRQRNRLAVRAASTPALYLAGNSGLAAATTQKSGSGNVTTTAADQQGRLIKLSDLVGTQQSAFSATASPDTGTTTAQATVVDSSGNVYVVGNATGNFGNQTQSGHAGRLSHQI